MEVPEDLIAPTVRQRTYNYNNFYKSPEIYDETQYMIVKENNARVKYTVPLYGSKEGKRVRNAVDGTYYPFYVGSNESASLFKVTESSGFKGRNHPLMLYFDSPKQYEEHMHVKTKANYQSMKKYYQSNSVSSSASTVIVK